MTHRKSSQFQSLRTQSDLEQPSELRRESKKDRSSVDELASRLGIGVRSEYGTRASVEEDEDPAANLFPVRTSSQSARECCKRAPDRAPPVVMFTNFKASPRLPW